MRRGGEEGTIGVTRGRGPGCNQLSVIAPPAGEGGRGSFYSQKWLPGPA